VGSRSSWIVAWLLAIAAPAVYLLWPGDFTWVAAVLLPMPLVGLALWRQDKKGFSDEFSGGADGPWGPP
jgi:hypothetical protein